MPVCPANDGSVLYPLKIVPKKSRRQVNGMTMPGSGTLRCSDGDYCQGLVWAVPASSADPDLAYAALHPRSAVSP